MVAIISGPGFHWTDQRHRGAIVNHGRLWIILLGMTTALLTSPAAAQPPDVYAPPAPEKWIVPFSDFTAGGGNRADWLGQASTFVPLFQSSGSVLFGQISLTTADDRIRGGETLEWNGGLGYRTFMDDYSIFGTYLFFDQRRTANHNKFSQTTVGMEWMSVSYDFRVNGYFPQSDGEPLGPHVAVLANDRIIVQGDEELAYYGADIECGVLLADWLEGDVELRAYGGAFYFDRNVEGFPEIAGPRVRAELRLYDLEWFGAGSRLVLSGQFQHDDYRDGQATGLVSLRIPLPGPANRPMPSRLQRRLVDPVVRDVEIVTWNGTRREVALDKETGQPLGPVNVVDALDDLQAEIDAAGEDSLLIVNGDQGQIDLTSSLSLMEGQTLRGAGFTVVGADTGSEAVYGMQPTLELLDPSFDVIVLNNRTRVRDLEISGGRNGVFGANVTEFRVDGNLIEMSNESGIRLVGGVEGDVDENVIIQAGMEGISIDTYASGFLGLNAVVESGGTGILVQELNGGDVRFNSSNENVDDGIAIVSLLDGTVGDNTARENGRHGFQVGTFDGGTFENNMAIQNGGQGFQFDVVEFNVGNMPEISSNTARENNGHGFHFTTLNGGNIQNNVARENLGDGFSITTNGQGSVENNQSLANQGSGFSINTFSNGFVTGNTADGNTLHGIQVGTYTNGFLSDNITTDNLLDGIKVVLKTGGFFSGNSASGNRDGISFGSVEGGFFDQNNASNNIRDGYVIGLFDTGGGAIGGLTENVASQNGDDGFDIDTWTSGQFNDNTSTLNTDFGYFINTRTGGTAAGNIATGNGNNTLP